MDSSSCRASFGTRYLTAGGVAVLMMVVGATEGWAQRRAPSERVLQRKESAEKHKQEQAELREQRKREDQVRRAEQMRQRELGILEKRRLLEEQKQVQRQQLEAQKGRQRFAPPPLQRTLSTRPSPGQAAKTPPPAPAHLVAMPSVAEVQQKIQGKDPVDTLARQTGAFRQLANVVRALSAGGEFGRGMISVEESNLMREYGNAARETEKKGRDLAASAPPGASKWAPLNPYDFESYRDEMLAQFWPGVARVYGSKFQTWEQKRAEQGRAWSLANERVQKERDLAVAERELADAKPDPSIEIARTAGVKTKVFDIQIGIPIRDIPICTSEKGKVCRASSGMAEMMSLFTLGGFSAPEGSMILGHPVVDWARLVYGKVRKGVLTTITVATEGDGRAQAYLQKTYGKASSRDGGTLEWVLPGLHIVYRPPSLSKLPQVSGRRADYRCPPGADDCDGTDEARADFQANLAESLGGAAALKTALAPNLTFETETEYKAGK